MILYVNGNDICGGAKCINNYRVARDDPKYTGSANKSHPENLMHSFGYYFSKMMGVGMRSEATVNSNDDIYDQTIKFVDVDLPRLRSYYTVIVIGWSPGASGKKINQLANKLKKLNIEFVFFCTQEPMPTKWEQSFDNLLDLKSQENCFLTWCHNNGHELKEDRYPDNKAHEEWAKHLFRLTIENQ